MNPKPYLTIVAALTGAGLTFAQQRVQQSELPASVRQTLNASTQQGGEIKEITRKSQNGRTVYEVEVENRLTIAEDGTVLNRSRGNMASTTRGAAGASEFRRAKEDYLDRQELTANKLLGKKIVDRSGKSLGEVKDIGFSSVIQSAQQSAQDQASRTDAGRMTGRTAMETQAQQVELYIKLDDDVQIGGDQLAAIPASRVSFDRQKGQLTLQMDRNAFVSQLRQSGSSTASQSTSTGQSAQQQSRQQQSGLRQQSGQQADQEDALSPTGVVIVEQYTLRPVDTESMIPLAQLPAAVRRGIEREAPGREIADVDREVSNGRVVYEVEFRDSGVNPRFHFNEDGTLLPADTSTRVRNFFAGTQISDTPAPVQETIRRESAAGRVTDVDIERRTGQTVYEVEIEDSAGRYEIHIAENGTILRHDRRVR